MKAQGIQECSVFASGIQRLLLLGAIIIINIGHSKRVVNYKCVLRTRGKASSATS